MTDSTEFGPEAVVKMIRQMVEFDRLPCGTERKPHVALHFPAWVIRAAALKGLDVDRYNVCARCHAPHPYEVDGD